MAYQYEAYTLDKKIVRGTIDASSESMAEGILYRSGYSHVLKLREVHPSSILERWLPSFFGVKTQDVIEFSRQLATLVESGMPIITALELIEKLVRVVAFKKIISGLSTELQGGLSLSRALSKYPRVFSNIYCQVIKASEYTGNIAIALRQAADYIEKNLVMTAKIKRAFAYPTFVLLMAIGVVILITNVALPPLVQLFTSLGAELPWTTRLLMFIATSVASYRFYLLGALFILIISIVGYTRLDSGKLLMDRLTLKIPLTGNISLLRNMTQFCRTVSVLLETGLPLPSIMNVVIGTMNNRIIRQALAEVRQKLIQGQGLSQPMAKVGLFPELLVEMVVIGERSGTLQSVLATLSDLYEKKVDQKVRVLISTIEHGLIVVIGVVVGFIGISMITPLYSILRTMH